MPPAVRAVDAVPPSPAVTAERREEVAVILDRVVEMARMWPDISAVGLCGSWATGRAGMGSDLDLCVVTRWRSDLARDPDWLAAQLGLGAHLTQRRQWGPMMTEMRFQTHSGLEVELGLVDWAWASTSPVDPGTASVVRDGFVVLHDQKSLLTALKLAVASSTT